MAYLNAAFAWLALLFQEELTVGGLVSDVTTAVTEVVPAATIAIFVGAGVVLALVMRFGRQILRWGR